MNQGQQYGAAELRAARNRNLGLFLFVGLFSVFVNLLMLTGPLFMLQVYDRVLGSRSEETLLALSVLVTFLFLMMGLLDFVRGRVLSRIGARFQDGLDRRVFAASLVDSAERGVGPDSGTSRDLETVQKLLASPVLGAAFDIPFAPLFIAGIYIFHPWLGHLAIAGTIVLICVTLLNQVTTRRPVAEAASAAMQADRMSDRLRVDANTIQSLGMRGAAFARWQQIRAQALAMSITASDKQGRFTAMTKTFRLFLQSAMLGLGAYLVLQNEMTAGAMIAGSILLGRALAPIELVIGQWSLVQSAGRSWKKLEDLLGRVPSEPPRTELPRPRAMLNVHQVTIVPPGEKQAVLRMASFRLEPGQAIGVIGPSGAGKSTLARAIMGAWRPAGGTIRLDGATLDQYDPDVLGRSLGYLPQTVTLFEGTVAENIARLDPNADDAAIVEAAKKAAAHEMILSLPDGYNTRVTALGGRLSGGQVQRVGLARALYGNPVILVLDEPNSNLDNEGSQALNQAIRDMKAAGNGVLIMAHRPAAIQECDKLLVLDGGAVKAFGPRDEVLGKIVRNANEIRAANTAGGVT
ncbi:type I secretion system permease/ATPase [Qingshengfaniella alkalisoli]|uniref:Type I secretion system permease/ATPase n=1 Tax=Qingshengfaniella alkalisoli TaxID=2599296 RepID=A0A5B8IA59_9RHOB|nr:type I secretion system permease/ATPase [Qingshengfaniella alkalisoli]QDY71305.1 type I secretion system permease/ATPase [Qingshengfaniella alkalisoli]